MKNRLSELIQKIDWVNTIFLLSTPVIAFAGVWYLVSIGGIHWATVFLTGAMAVVTGLAITAGYHRLFSHKSFDANWVFKLVMLVLGAAAFENSALRWASDHRRHHKFVDTDQDPYNIKRGFWYAHMGWVMLKYGKYHAYDNVADLESDPLIRFQEKNYVWIGIMTGFLLPTLVAGMWGDALGGLLMAGFFRTVINHHFTFSINSFAHLIGKQPYSDQNTSRDSWFLAFFTYGEGYHNFHHKFPSDYRNGIHAYHWDPTKWLVRATEYFGQTYNLRRIPSERILVARLKMDEKRLLVNLIKQPSHARKFSHEFVVAARVKIEEAHVQFRALKMEYYRLKNERMKSINTQISLLNERLHELKDDLNRSRGHLKQALSEWSRLCSSAGIRSVGFLYN